MNYSLGGLKMQSTDGKVSFIEPGQFSWMKGIDIDVISQYCANRDILLLVEDSRGTWHQVKRYRDGSAPGLPE